MLEPAQRPVVEPMRAQDLDAVYSIAHASFPAPWSRQMLAEDLYRPFAYVRVLRASPHDPITAFAGSWVVSDELHVLNLATHPRARGRGYGRMLMEDALAYARQRCVRTVTLEVRQSNRAAYRLYERLGFRSIGVRPGYYENDGEDAIVMLLRL